MTDEKLIGFCICTNDDEMFEDCKWYLDRLIVPDGYKMEVVPVRNASGMCEGYNSFMEKSNAGYKVYMHHDVSIINRNFIKDALAVFEADSKVGMLGVFGATKLVQDAEMWNHWNVGKVDACNGFSVLHVEGQNEAKASERFWEAKAVDGLLIMTNQDIRWRDDLGLGWDFYDITQSLEFIKAGWKVAVSCQAEPWCFHDCGISKLINYDDARKKVMEAYPEFFSATFEPTAKKALALERDKIADILKGLIESGNMEEFIPVADSLQAYSALEAPSFGLNNDIIFSLNMAEIYKLEKERNLNYSFAGSKKNFENCKKEYVHLKHLLRRVEYSDEQGEVIALKEYVAQKEITPTALSFIGQNALSNWHETIKKLVE